MDMTKTPISTQFSTLSFRPGKDSDISATSADLHAFLQTLISENLTGTGRISATEKQNWVTLIDGLSEHFLATFPPSGSAVWKALEEKAELCLVSLEVIKRASRRVETMFLDLDDHTPLILCRILTFLRALATWDVPAVSDGNAYGPYAMRDVAIAAIAAIAQCIVENGTAKSRLLEAVRVVSLRSAKDILASIPNDVWPLHIEDFVLSKEGSPNDGQLLVKGELKSAFHATMLLVDLLRIATHCVRLESSYLSYLTDSQRLVVYWLRRALDLFLSSELAIPMVYRVESSVRILESVRLLKSMGSGSDNSLATIPTVLLLFRLRDGPGIDWQVLDDVLLTLFNHDGWRLEPGDANLTILQLGLRQDWRQAEATIVECASSAIKGSLNATNPQLIEAMLSELSAKESLPLYSSLKPALEDALKRSLVPSETVNVLGKRKRNGESWRTEIIKILQKDILDSNETTLVQDENLNDAAWVARVLEIVKTAILKSTVNSSKEWRLQVTMSLKSLACAIAHSDQPECHQESNAQGPVLSLIPTYLACLTSLQGGSDVEASPAVLRAVQDAFSTCIRHHTQGFNEERLDAAKNFIRVGLEDPNRSTRLAAGRALVELIRLYQRLGRGLAASRCLDNVFKIIVDLLGNAKDSVKETTLLCVGYIGRIDDADVLGRALHCLFVQIDQRNILLKSVTYTQLLSLAKYHKKTPYALVLPYMEQIAVHVVSVMTTQPNALIETCRFLSISASDYLTVTLPLTLPHLFGQCNKGTLARLSIELDVSISNMFLKESADILAHVFLLRNQLDTSKALAFILRTLNEAATNAGIQLSNVVKSCVLPLLGKLVIGMGDPDHEAAENAAQAIRKVERSLNVTSSRRPSASQSLGTFLKGNMLAIIAHLNDVLQDVHGRQTFPTKRKVILGLNSLIKEVGPAISAVAPQIMATLQTTVSVPLLSESALQTWYTFLTTLSLKDIGPHVGPTTASIVNAWPSLSMHARSLAQQSIDYLLSDAFTELGSHLGEIVDFSGIPELASSTERIRELRNTAPVNEYLIGILDRLVSDNLTVVGQGLQELKKFMLSRHSDFIRDAASGDIFDPLVGKIVKAVMTVACRDGENMEALRLIAYECIGILGAVDPDRFDIPTRDTVMVVVSNFTDEEEAMQFALHLVQSALVGAFRSTSDIKYQSHLAFAIQELLKFCKFTPDLLMPGTSVPIRVRNRWAGLPKHVHETVTPLLEARFTVSKIIPEVPVEHPIYRTQPTYREWIQLWTSSLITRASGQTAKKIFDTVRLVIKHKDAAVAYQLLPHLVLNILISGEDEDTKKIRAEITVVLEDQLDEASQSSPEKRLLSAQAVFMLMDHLNKWVRIMRLEISAKRNESRRSRNHSNHEAELQVTRVDSILESIDQVLIAKAAFRCKSYARSLMNFERQVLATKGNNTARESQQVYFDRLHEIYSHLDEPDGMEGVSTFVILPSIEHQIRQHESTGRWTSAQSCWEVRLQQSPDKLDYHLGLLRCLRSLGHYDSLRTHIQGILVRNPEWEKPLSGFNLEGAWMSGDWQSVKDMIDKYPQGSWEHPIARILLALKSQDDSDFTQATSLALMELGAPVTGAGEIGYRRAYDAALKLHLVHDIQIVRKSIVQIQHGGQRRQILSELFGELTHRLSSTLPTFRVREPILSIHRTTFALSQEGGISFRRAVGKTWLESAKVARKAGHWQTAYSAILQAQECKAPLTFVQSAKLVRTAGEPLRALYELDNALQATEERLRPNISQRLVDLTEEEDELDDKEWKRLHGKAKLLLTRWMQESERYDVNLVAKQLTELTSQLSDVESAHFHAGHFQDEQYKQLGNSDKRKRGLRMNLFTIRSYAMSLRIGSKYAYQTIPRLLTIWLDMGEDEKLSQNEIFSLVNRAIQDAILHIPKYKWLTAFPQIASRVDHKNNQVFPILSHLIVEIIREYPQQGLWLFMSSVKSTKSKREKRGRAILEQLNNNPQNAGTNVPTLIASSVTMATELLRLCDHPIRDDGIRTLSMSKDMPSLAKLVPSPLIIPLQESMTVSLPATSSIQSVHQPFPPDAPTIAAFYDEIDIMKSLAKPRKITIKGSDGKIYMFLGKPKDDLRKDARLMDFNSIINKLLRTNSESRRRQLRIRTYSVVTLNEECGFIQWVPNTTPIRPILLKYYAARGVEAWNRDMGGHFAKIKEAAEKEASVIFQEKILPLYPPIFHEWFLDTFPEPTVWLSSRLAYGRTAAVMCMVGFILGLGDRHLENILLDINTGDLVHVDFNCLFEKGKTLETPERVPFRLTSNMVDGLGVTGVEGVFRIASEITMQLLRDNKDVLMSVLDAFIHDPLVEWEDEKRRMERQARRGDINAVKEAVDLRKLAKNALYPIEKKLKGIYAKDNDRGDKKEKEVSTSNLVQMLIEEATDLRNLAKMYPGWAPWH